MKKTMAIATLILGISLVSCSHNNGRPSLSTSFGSSVTITDMLNRTVTVNPTEIKKIVCIGAGALRLYTYIGDLSKLSGVEDVEKKFIIALRPYQDAFFEQFKLLPSCGVGGPQNQAAEAEKILSCDPDLVISLYTQSAAAMNQLSEQVNAPVVTLSYGDEETFSDEVYQSLTILGKVLNKESKTSELITYIKGMQSELSKVGEGVANADKETFYVACQSNYGTQGFRSSSSDYSIFTASNVRNILDEDDTYADKGYNKVVDIEKILTMNPDNIVIDAGGLKNFKTELATTELSSAIMTLEAVKNHAVYIQLPYNAYYTNLETAYIDAYYVASLSYPNKMKKGFNIADKADEIYKTFLGIDNYYTNVVSKKLYGGFQQVTDDLQTWVNTNVR